MMLWSCYGIAMILDVFVEVEWLHKIALAKVPRKMETFLYRMIGMGSK